MSNRESMSHFEARVLDATGVRYEDIPLVPVEDLDRKSCLGPIFARRGPAAVYGADEFHVENGVEIWTSFVRIDLT
jgi:hypothetical protein